MGACTCPCVPLAVQASSVAGDKLAVAAASQAIIVTQGVEVYVAGVKNQGLSLDADKYLDVNQFSI